MHRGMPKVNLKTHFKKNHALAESLLSRVFSWDVVDVGFPTCSSSSLLANRQRYQFLEEPENYLRRTTLAVSCLKIVHDSTNSEIFEF
jgi:hypothetical protein